MKKHTFKFLVSKAAPAIKKGGSYVAAAAAGDVIGDAALEAGKRFLSKRKEQKRRATAWKHIHKSPKYQRYKKEQQDRLSSGIKKIYKQAMRKRRP